jgi:soluble lytic murein transglycosylase-like protein
VSTAALSAPAIPAHLKPLFVAAGHAYGIPPQVLAAVSWEETGFGANRGPSRAGALGLMQFEPDTARELGINPLNDRQAVFGTAEYLTQLGYHHDPERALAAYNAGPGNVAAGVGYARAVLQKARALGATNLAAGPAPAPAGGGGGGFGHDLLGLGLKGAFVVSGAWLVWVGARLATGPAAGVPA